MNRSLLLHKFSTLYPKKRVPLFEIRERERERAMVYNPGLECLSRLARDVEEAINPGVSRAKIRGSISGSKKSMNHRRGRAPSQN